MSTKQTDANTIEVRLYGPGATTVGLFDTKGRALLVKRLIVSGPQEVEARSRLPRSVQVRGGDLPVVPVLMHRVNDKQRVTFEGKEAETATAEKYRAMKFSKAVLGKIREATALVASRGGDPGAMVSLSTKR